MIAALIPAITSIISSVIDKAVPDKAQAESLKAELTLQVLKINEQELKAASSIIMAEAQGESWLQRNWRPCLMIWFAGLVGAYWFGFTPENLPTEVIQDLFELVKIGVGGYVVGRSGEKIVKEWKKQT